MSIEKFGTNFEEKVIQSMLADHAFAEQLLDVVEPELFDLASCKELSRVLKEYYFKYQAFPTVSLLSSICQQEIKVPALKLECVNFIERIQKKPLNGDLEYVKEKSLQFFRTQNLKNILANEVLPRMKASNLEEILPIIQNALSKGTDKNIGYDYLQDEEDRFVEDQEAKVPTLWPVFNEIFNGGFGNKRLITFIGSSGAGKSHWLVNVGYGALLEGKTVVHYTLELDNVDIARRYDARFADVLINDVPANKTKVLLSIKKKMKPTSKLIIKEYPMKSASIQTIKAHLTKLRLNDVVPDIILIDYGDLLKFSSTTKENRHNLEAIWQDMKALAQELQIPVVTATQTNRSGYNSEIITPDQISEDFSKVMHSDVIITAARDMAQKALGIGKVYIAKNRQGYDGQILNYTIDTGKAKIEIYELKAEDASTPMAEYEGKTTADQLKDYLAKNGTN